MVALPQTVSPTIAAIEAAVEAAESRDFDRVIRGSSIGHPCERHLWYRFRWAHLPEQFDGRKLRLFHTGHAEEARMVAWLRMAGVEVEDVDPVTGEQWEVVAVDGHFKGHTDGKLTGVIEAPVVQHLLECKTHNAKSFDQLKKFGVEVAKPEHVAQMQGYMHLLGLTRAFYLAKHKDTDDLYAERIHYNAAQGAALIAKAERIKDANSAPVRVSDDPNYFMCKAFNCASYGVCHGSCFALRNCRTCLHSTPINDGQWYCQRHEKELSTADQKAGCPTHLFLPSLVPGEQIDADEQSETVIYRLGDGSEWIDGPKEA
ncbi:oxidoreductase [Ochrobactrum intermedium]|uniref:oxidoreductase n=1 Tax=Brucella intermedia TaxID=94625 RepID=UPI00159C344C|nr:oxidoreductase [Brucella intermedia]NVM43164.1 oxidoreductase [Brucella intermedia]